MAEIVGLAGSVIAIVGLGGAAFKLCRVLRRARKSKSLMPVEVENLLAQIVVSGEAIKCVGQQIENIANGSSDDGPRKYLADFFRGNEEMVHGLHKFSDLTRNQLEESARNLQKLQRRSPGLRTQWKWIRWRYSDLNEVQSISLYMQNIQITMNLVISSISLEDHRHRPQTYDVERTIKTLEKTIADQEETIKILRDQLQSQGRDNRIPTSPETRHILETFSRAVTDLVEITESIRVSGGIGHDQSRTVPSSFHHRRNSHRSHEVHPSRTHHSGGSHVGRRNSHVRPTIEVDQLTPEAGRSANRPAVDIPRRNTMSFPESHEIMARRQVPDLGPAGSQLEGPSTESEEEDDTEENEKQRETPSSSIVPSPLSTAPKTPISQYVDVRGRNHIIEFSLDDAVVEEGFVIASVTQERVPVSAIRVTGSTENLISQAKADELGLTVSPMDDGEELKVRLESRIIHAVGSVRAKWLEKRYEMSPEFQFSVRIYVCPELEPDIILGDRFYGKLLYTRGQTLSSRTEGTGL